MDVTIRAARPEDDFAIGELLVDAFMTAYARKMPEVQYTEERKRALRSVSEKRAVAHVWVAERAGKVVGTIALFGPGAKDSEAWLPDTADLRHLATSPEVHGQGLSKPLIEVAVQKARELGAKAISLHVRRGAVGVARLYEKHGWVRAPEGDLDTPTVYLEGFIKRL